MRLVAEGVLAAAIGLPADGVGVGAITGRVNVHGRPGDLDGSSPPCCVQGDGDRLAGTCNGDGGVAFGEVGETRVDVGAVSIVADKVMGRCRGNQGGPDKECDENCNDCPRCTLGHCVLRVVGYC